MTKHSGKWKCLVIDDEPLAAELISSYVETVNELELAGVCNNALDALTILRQQSIDLLFLDIEMPRLTGLEFLRVLPNPPAIIIISAYREFAVEGFELNVTDYLVKPVTLERFLRAINKLMVKQPAPVENNSIKEDSYVLYKVDRNIEKVYLKDILWIESLKDYIKIILSDKRTLITYQRISYAEQKLPESQFMRIHRSFIVAKDKVTGYNNSTIRVENHELPIGKSYKKKVLDEII